MKNSDAKAYLMWKMLCGLCHWGFLFLNVNSCSFFVQHRDSENSYLLHFRVPFTVGGQAQFCFYCWCMDREIQGCWSKRECVEEKLGRQIVILYFFSPFHEHLSLGVFTSLSRKLPHLQLLFQFLLTSLLHLTFPGWSALGSGVFSQWSLP